LAGDYQKITFKNGEAPAINATNLNHMQTQYDKAKELVDTHKAEKATDTSVGHAQVDGETIVSNNGILSCTLMKAIKGSYVGDGTTDREIEVGGRPKFVMISGTIGTNGVATVLFFDTNDRGAVYGTNRNSASVDARIGADISNPTITNNGFIIPHGGDNSYNALGKTFDYIAFI
jgi:hypothetical protein